MESEMTPTSELRICARMKEIKEVGLFSRRTRVIRDYNTIQQKFINPANGDAEWRELPVHEIPSVG